MPRTKSVNWQAVTVAAEPQSVIARWQLIELGVSDRMIWERTRPGGLWQRLLPGVVCLHNGEPTWLQLVEAALRYARRGAIVTGLAAARLHGLRRIPNSERVHLLVPGDKQPATHDQVIIERTTRLPPPERRNGFPVAPVARAVLDGARRLTRQDQIDALIAEAVQRGFTSPRRLSDELAAGSNRGASRPRSTIRAMLAGARSKAEADALRLVSGTRLPRPQWNPTLRRPDGVRLPTPDGWFDDVALAWESTHSSFTCRRGTTTVLSVGTRS